MNTSPRLTASRPLQSQEVGIMVARDVFSSHPSGLAGQVHQGIGRLGCSTMEDGLERNHAASVKPSHRRLFRQSRTIVCT